MSARTSSTFAPSWWLPGPHLQSIWATFTRSARRVTFTREVLTTPDGDELALDHVDGAPDAPRALVLHGLEGSSHAVYVQGMAELASRAGWAVTCVNFRSCARDLADISRTLPNRTPRLYHSGETEDFGLVLETLAAREPARKLVAAGVSLGGNVILKWLGEHPEQRLLAAAATISVPYDLEACAHRLTAGYGLMYGERFLRSLKPKVELVLERHPELAARVDRARVQAARTLFEFDELATAPLHGFADARDYYVRSSSLAVVDRINVPALCINALDDPFLPPEALDRMRERAPAHVELVTPPTGGHAGFVAGPWPGFGRCWAEEEAVAFLARAVR
jgi:predicted alpha/beta-fold hydrolase